MNIKSIKNEHTNMSQWIKNSQYMKAVYERSRKVEKVFLLLRSTMTIAEEETVSLLFKEQKPKKTRKKMF